MQIQTTLLTELQIHDTEDREELKRVLQAGLSSITMECPETGSAHHCKAIISAIGVAIDLDTRHTVIQILMEHLERIVKTLELFRSEATISKLICYYEQLAALEILLSFIAPTQVSGKLQLQIWNLLLPQASKDSHVFVLMARYIGHPEPMPRYFFASATSFTV